jgi:hypothetical protein
MNKIPIKNKDISQQGLLKVSQNISLYYVPEVSNDSKLVILPVDPLHLYAYWTISESKERLSQAKTERDEVLRLYSQEEREGGIQCKPVINMSIQSFQSSQMISLPIVPERKSYFVSIGELTEEHEFTPIVTSKSTGYVQVKKSIDDHLIAGESKTSNQWDAVIENIFSIHENKYKKPSHHAHTNFSGLGLKA